MKRIDLRIPRKPGSTITIDGADYTIGSECFRGGTALCYSASRDGQTEHYAIKEIYPLAGAGRDNDGDVCSTSGNSYEICLQSFQNEVILMESASSDTFQSWHYEQFDIARGIGIMRMNTKDTQRLDKAVTKYAGQNHTPMERLGWALRITRSLLTGLHKIHTNAHLLHLDLSLANIFLSQDGNGPNAFFLDFGEARQLNDLNVCPADSGSTSLFGAPERFSRSTRTISPAADTFSAAVLFYHILTTGSWAYQNQPIPEAAMLSKWDCAEAKYGLGCMGLPVGTEKAVFQFLKKGMAYRPDRRYQTAMEMLEQVERLLQIVSQKGIFRELILDRSVELYQKTVFYKIAPELEPQIPTSDRQHILYLGDGGSGKTTHLFTLWKQTLEKAAEDFCSPLPIYVSVSKFEGQDSNFIIDQILKYYIKDWDGGDDVGRKQINKLLSTESYVLFLDGLNESTMPDGLYQQIELLTKYPMLRIYAASRVPFDGKAWDCFEKINISALTKEQVDYVLKLFQRYDTYNDKLLETLRRPMFMAIFLRLEPLRFSKEISTPGEILDAYWEHLIVQFRDANHPDRNAALWKYALNTALPRFSAENKSLHFSDHQVNFRYPAQEIIQVWKNCGVVRMVHYSEIDDREDYVFAHQNYRDFAVAKRLAAEMKEWNSNSKMFLSSGPFEESVLSYLGDILGEYAYAGKTQLPINSPVEKWMQEHLAGKNGPTAQIVVRNLIECMKYNRNNCITAKYDGLDLSLVRFYGSRLPGSSFHNALVTHHSFVNDGHSDRVDVLALASKKQLLITVEHDKIFVWDMVTGLVKYTIELDISFFVLPTDPIVDYIDISPDEELFLIRCRGSYDIQVYRLEDGNPVLSYASLDELIDADYDRLDSRIGLMFGGFGLSSAYFLKSENTNTVIMLIFSCGFAYHIDPFSGKRVTDTVIFEFSPDVDDLIYAVSLNREKFAMCLSYNTIQIIDSKTLKSEPLLCDNAVSYTNISKMVLTPDGNYLVAELDREKLNNPAKCIAVCLQTGRIIECSESILLGGRVYPYGCGSDLLLYGCQDQKIVHWNIDTNSYRIINKPWKEHRLFLSSNRENFIFCTRQLDVHVTSAEKLENIKSISVGYIAPNKYMRTPAYSGNNLWMRLTQYQQIQIMDLKTKDTMTFNCDTVNKGDTYLFCNNRFACMERHSGYLRNPLIKRTVWPIQDRKMVKLDVPAVAGRNLGIFCDTDRMYICDDIGLHIMNLAENPPTVHTIAQLWASEHIRDGRRRQPFSRYIDKMCCIIPEQNVVVRCDRRGRIRVWDLDNGNIVTDQVLFPEGEDIIKRINYVPQTGFVVLEGGWFNYQFDLSQCQKIASWDIDSTEYDKKTAKNSLKVLYELDWPLLDTADITHCDFRRTIFPNDGVALLDALRMNGAIID